MIVTFIGEILCPEQFFQALSLTAGVPWSKLSRQAIRIPGAHVRGDLVQALRLLPLMSVLSEEHRTVVFVGFAKSCLPRHGAYRPSS
jgi:hypothetical protein